MRAQWVCSRRRRIALCKRSSINQKTAFNAALFSTLTVSDLGSHQVICWVLYKHFQSQCLQVQTQSKWQSQWEFKSYPSLCVCPSCILILVIIFAKFFATKHGHQNQIFGVQTWYSGMSLPLDSRHNVMQHSIFMSEDQGRRAYLKHWPLLVLQYL